MSDFPAAYFETRFRFPEGIPDGYFAILTAFNPMDRRFSDRVNSKADHRLRRLLERKLLPHHRALGGSPDQLHQEPGWAVTTDLDEAIEIGRRFKQRGIWWIEDNRLHLVSCLDRSVTEIGDLSERIDAPTS